MPCKVHKLVHAATLYSWSNPPRRSRRWTARLRHAPRRRKRRNGAMALTPDHDEERAARIDQLLEQLRLTTEDLHELGKQAVDRARAASRAAESTVEKLQAEQSPAKPQETLDLKLDHYSNNPSAPHGRNLRGTEPLATRSLAQEAEFFGEF